MGKSLPVDQVKEATIPTTMLKAMGKNIQWRSPVITILLILHQYEFLAIKTWLQSKLEILSFSRDLGRDNYRKLCKICNKGKINLQ